jgi:hypothetical protein
VVDLAFETVTEIVKPLIYGSTLIVRNEEDAVNEERMRVVALAGENLVMYGQIPSHPRG